MTLGALAALIGISLVVQTAADPGRSLTPRATMSFQTQHARMQPLIRSANECIARTVFADPRFGTEAGSSNVSGLIVDSVPACVEAIHAIIAQHDEFYGAGTGEIFFMGPFLDALPSNVHQLIGGLRH